MDEQSRVNLFDDWAKNYDPSVQSVDEFPFDGYDRLLDRIAFIAGARPNQKVLDLGIGTGNLASRFAACGASIWGLDFSNQMLLKTKEKLPQAQLAQADLLGKWPETFQQKYDRIISAYVFHEFDLSTKMDLIQRLAEFFLEDNGFLVIGDISFPASELREKAKESIGERWDEDEFYWAADETLYLCEELGLNVVYEQISSCAGIFVVKPWNEENVID